MAKNDKCEERWISYPGIKIMYYEIDNEGRIRCPLSSKEIKVHEDKDGYYRVTLYSESYKKYKQFGVHRLVAWEFCKHKKGCYVVNHIDGNKKNNKSSNLEWTTPLENTRHALRMGLQCNSGPNCPSAVYTEETIRDICTKLEKGRPVLEIYRDYYPNDKKKITNRAFYQLIYTIMDGTRHVSISKEYKIDKSKCESNAKKRFTKKEVNVIRKMLKKGYRNIDILNFFGYTHTRDCRRLSDKIRIEKKKLKQS